MGIQPSAWLYFNTTLNTLTISNIVTGHLTTVVPGRAVLLAVS